MDHSRERHQHRSDDDVTARVSEGIIARRQQATFYEGPIPDPDTLQRYGVNDATLPNRIVSMAEDTLQANIDNSRTLVKGETKAIQRSIDGGLILAALSMVGAFVLAVLGVPAWWLFLFPAALNFAPRVIRALKGVSAEDEPETT